MNDPPINLPKLIPFKQPTHDPPAIPQETPKPTQMVPAFIDSSSTSSDDIEILESKTERDSSLAVRKQEIPSNKPVPVLPPRPALEDSPGENHSAPVAVSSPFRRAAARGGEGIRPRPAPVPVGPVGRKIPPLLERKTPPLLRNEGAPVPVAVPSPSADPVRVKEGRSTPAAAPIPLPGAPKGPQTPKSSAGEEESEVEFDSVPSSLPFIPEENYNYVESDTEAPQGPKEMTLAEILGTLRPREKEEAKPPTAARSAKAQTAAKAPPASKEQRQTERLEKNPPKTAPVQPPKEAGMNERASLKELIVRLKNDIPEPAAATVPKADSAIHPPPPPPPPPPNVPQPFPILRNMPPPMPKPRTPSFTGPVAEGDVRMASISQNHSVLCRVLEVRDGVAKIETAPKVFRVNAEKLQPPDSDAIFADQTSALSFDAPREVASEPPRPKKVTIAPPPFGPPPPRPVAPRIVVPFCRRFDTVGFAPNYVPYFVIHIEGQSLTLMSDNNEKVVNKIQPNTNVKPPDYRTFDFNNNRLMPGDKVTYGHSEAIVRGLYHRKALIEMGTEKFRVVSARQLVLQPVTPSMNVSAPSSPMTLSPTPAQATEVNGDVPFWFVPGAVVKTKDGGNIAVIKSISGQIASIETTDPNTRKTISLASNFTLLEPTLPVKNSQSIFISKNRCMSGNVISVATDMLRILCGNMCYDVKPSQVCAMAK